MQTIFIQIASYRDPRLVATIQDALDKSAHPERLRFGICHQHHPDDLWDNLERWSGDRRFCVDDVDARKSRGCCWARHRMQQFYAGEDYALQLDSHHLFVVGWDDILIDMLERCPSKKPIISCYLPECRDLASPTAKLGADLLEMRPHFSNDPVIIQYKSQQRKGGGLKRHMHWSGHFTFARGQYILDVPYDPDLYFIGEEVSMAVRSYTHGYDMYLPDTPVAWHEYTRAKRPKHWKDHSARNRANNEIEHIFHELDARSKKKVRSLLRGEVVASCGLGSERSLEDYEDAAGILFKSAFVHPRATRMEEAPIFSSGSDWRDVPQYAYKVVVDWTDIARGFSDFAPNKLAIFCRNKRVDVDVLPGGSTCTELSIVAPTPPEFAKVWPYRFHPHPLKWGRKKSADITIIEETKVNG